MHQGLKEVSKAMLYISGVISLVFAALGTLLINDGAAYAENYDYLVLVGKKGSFIIGIMIGYILTAVKIIMIDLAREKAFYMDMREGRAYASSQYLLRFLLTGVVLLASLLIPEISFIGTFLSILSLQLAGYLVHGYERRV